jgi:hypothetical protein
MNPTIAPEKINKILKTNNPETIIAVLKNPSISSQQLFDFITNGTIDKHNYQIKSFAIKNPNLSEKHINLLLTHPKHIVREITATFRKLTEQQFKIAINYGMKADLSLNKHLSTEQIDFIINSNYDTMTLNNIAQNINLTESQITKLFNTNNLTIQLLAIGNKNATPKNIDQALDSDFKNIREEAIKNINISNENLIKAFKDKEHSVRYTAISRKKIPLEIINIALNDPSIVIRNIAIKKLYKITKKSLKKRTIKKEKFKL